MYVFAGVRLTIFISLPLSLSLSLSPSLPLPYSDVLREGDELLEVNGVPVTGRSTDEIVRLMVRPPPLIEPEYCMYMVWHVMSVI